MSKQSLATEQWSRVNPKLIKATIGCGTLRKFHMPGKFSQTRTCSGFTWVLKPLEIHLKNQWSFYEEDMEHSEIKNYFPIGLANDQSMAVKKRKHK